MDTLTSTADPGFADTPEITSNTSPWMSTVEVIELKPHGICNSMIANQPYVPRLFSAYNIQPGLISCHGDHTKSKRHKRTSTV
ncbi:hypothetical protein CDAR_395411 [Caerostris darwini]|uniref:Uncharacterized protein n=1 Tax=Caerostris darwini TaxID=1538125 RepID=A0AAV4V8P0_9ARAC|nr:hypothetical protein CDAR_395411 [Caerostris darwini]